jgi:hypothetical protein
LPNSTEGIFGRERRTGGGSGASPARLHAAHNGIPGPSATAGSISNNALHDGQAAFMRPVDLHPWKAGAQMNPAV